MTGVLLYLVLLTLMFLLCRLKRLNVLPNFVAMEKGEMVNMFETKWFTFSMRSLSSSGSFTYNYAHLIFAQSGSNVFLGLVLFA